MTIPAELSQVARTLTYNGSGSTAEVGIGTTVNIAGGLEIKGIQVISPAGIWQGSAAGIQGTQGTQGIQGIQGSQGIQGIQGSQGIQGTQGIQGILGTQGIQGSQGIQGTQGIQGATGSQGTTGAQGASGTQGIQGITGPTGGTSGQVLYNSGGTATSSSNLTFDGTSLVCGGTIRASNTSIDPSNVGAGFAAGNIFETSTGFSAPGICFGSGAGQHGAIVYASGTMYFGSENGSDNTMGTVMTLSSNGNLNFNSGYGSVAVAFGCRAWVNFDGTSGSIRGSANVTSVTRNSTGNYTINFSSSMPDANYCPTVSISQGASRGLVHQVGQTGPNLNSGNYAAFATGSLKIVTGDPSSSVPYDPNSVNVAILR